MCGIAGIVPNDHRATPDRSGLERMITALHHRGPDGYGFHVAEGVGLAHARLSIIDLTTGDQPIRNETGSIWIVFNGEIFNYPELRAQLEPQGHRFYTRSDTEVIVHAYEQYGLDFVDHLNGQFAIALWDAPRRRLVLARDRVGIRPLLYTATSRGLAFASVSLDAQSVRVLRAPNRRPRCRSRRRLAKHQLLEEVSAHRARSPAAQ